MRRELKEWLFILGDIVVCICINSFLLEAEMNKLYAIGEVSKIMGVSVQTLRYYANIKLVEPEYISPQTGYRYYSDEQFHFIDRIKYLQKLDFTLDEIHSILLRNDIGRLINMLDDKKEDLLKETKRLHEKIDLITWYHDYFLKSKKIDKSHVSHFNSRYLMAIKIEEGESRESYHIRLHKEKSKLKGQIFKRQFCLILNYDDFIEGKNFPTHIGMFLKDKPQNDIPNVMEIPEGDYFCMTERILSESSKPYEANVYFQHLNYKPKLVLANEYENSLKEYTQCPYEIQILI